MKSYGSDLKPSNVLVFNTESRLGDLGRSICKDLDGPYSKRAFTGDFTYAPPEIWYRYYERDWNKRVFATDCYMLGSLVVFYFTGISMSALDKQIKSFNARMVKKEAYYVKMFSALDIAMMKAEDQMSWLQGQVDAMNTSRR